MRPTGAKSLRKKYISRRKRPSAAKADAANKPFIAAVNRCATQNQAQYRLFPQTAKARIYFQRLSGTSGTPPPHRAKTGRDGDPGRALPFPCILRVFPQPAKGGFTGRNLDASRIVPIGVCRGGNETHRALGEGGDGQTGVDAKIRCHYRSIADV